MINLSDLVAQAREEGYEGVNAEAKACQDIILFAFIEIYN